MLYLFGLWIDKFDDLAMSYIDHPSKGFVLCKYRFRSSQINDPRILSGVQGITLHILTMRYG